MPPAADPARHAECPKSAAAGGRPSGRPGRQSASPDPAEDRLFDRGDRGASPPAPLAQAEARGDLHDADRRAGEARRVCRSDARRHLEGTARGDRSAQPEDQPALSRHADVGRHGPHDPRVHQAKDQRRPVADRCDRAAAQHPAQDLAGDRRSPDGVFAGRPRGDRAAQDAADRRPHQDARDDGQPGR